MNIIDALESASFSHARRSPLTNWIGDDVLIYHKDGTHVKFVASGARDVVEPLLKARNLALYGPKW
jgi:hypothetical protein